MAEGLTEHEEFLRRIEGFAQSSLVAAPKSVNKIDRVLDSLGRFWDEALHPRGDDGRFIKKNGAVSGKLMVPNKDRSGYTTVDANRASVVGFHAFDDEVWVLAEIDDGNGNKTQGFARSDDIRAVAPVKARLDALYPVPSDTTDSSFVPAATERKRQIDLVLSYINDNFGSNNDTEGAQRFLDSIGLLESDMQMINNGDDENFLGGIRKVDRDLTPSEIEERDDIIEDAKQVKALRDRVHGIGVEVHEQPKQESTPAKQPVSAAEDLYNGVSPLNVQSDDLLADMDMSGRFTTPKQYGNPGISPIEWRVDDGEDTGYRVALAGTGGQTTTGKAYFVKQSVIGADMNNSDVAKEVLASLMTEQLQEVLGDDDRILPVPKSRFGDNPVWDGFTPKDDTVHQPAHVISDHAAYTMPSDWTITTMMDGETSLYNDMKTAATPEAAEDMKSIFYEDIGDQYGNDISKMVLFDFLTLNSDRNLGNAVLGAPMDEGEGKVALIDHGSAFDVDPLDGEVGDTDAIFDWFMDYSLTQPWLAYILGGLEVNGNVTPKTLRSNIEGFVSAYKNLDTKEILTQFSSMPNVTDNQIDMAKSALEGVTERLSWMENNVDKILSRITRRK